MMMCIESFVLQDQSMKALSYDCLWCKKKSRISLTSNSNLKVHRDGSSQQGRSGHGCPNRALALSTGHKLPLSISERRALKKSTEKDTQVSITKFIGRAEKFDNRVLNQLLSMWQVHHAIPWLRIQDPLLKAAFTYARSDTNLFGRKWAAEEANRLYLSLRTSVIDELKVRELTL